MARTDRLLFEPVSGRPGTSDPGRPPRCLVVGVDDLVGADDPAAALPEWPSMIAVGRRSPGGADRRAGGSLTAPQNRFDSRRLDDDNY
ncbi:hypothetical protein SDC9_159377 [bioreactor metagenome]|uniref:Uncharacterized protein n=1 Tax=bioreactor metagenome TaxID=1076179 RepID=A0A645FCQ5_9ZZZZ